jgi:hypothetical protein
MTRGETLGSSSGGGCVDKRVPNGLLPAIVLAIGTLVLVFVRAFKSPYGDGWNDILEFAPFYVGAIAAAFVLIASSPFSTGTRMPETGALLATIRTRSCSVRR